MATRTGIYYIAVKRDEQILKHYYTTEDDVRDCSNYQLMTKARDLLFVGPGYVDRLAQAGALIAAEIDRVNYRRTV